MKKDSLIYKIVLCSIFSTIIFTIFAGNIIKKDSDISYLENRNLKKMPKASFESIINGDFTSEFESYISDQFILRDSFIKLKANTEILLGKNKINDIYIGKENILFEDFACEDPESIKEKAKAINDFVKQNDDLNVSMMLVPTAVKVLEEKMPSYSNTNDELEYIDIIKNSLNEKVKFIEVYSTLRKNRNKDIFYKTDHHWTTKGAYLSYVQMCKTLNLKYKEEKDYIVKSVSTDFYGSLYYKLGAGIGNTDEIQVYIPKEENKVVVNYVDENKKSASFYESDKLDTKDKYEVFMGGNHSLVHINTSIENDKKLLVIKDSYANSFIPFLSENYKEIIVLDLRYYNNEVKDVIETYGISDVLLLYNVNTFSSDKSILNLVN